MWYVYAILSLKNKRFYIGFTSDLKRRIGKHNSKRGGKYTSRNSPFKLIFYEAFLDKKDATKQEGFYKTGNGREILKKKIENSLLKLKT